MRVAKGLLLGSAAALVATGGAQAADLPVKAQPVQFVKICSLYGAGFYYVPGTDMCLKIGGWVRAEYAYGNNGNFAWGWASNNVNDRRHQQQHLARARLHHGRRTQPDRIRHRARLSRRRPEHQLNRRRQRAEHVQRQPRLHPVGGLHLRSVAVVLRLLQLTGDLVLGFVPGVRHGDGGWMVAGYTAQFGNGWSARSPQKCAATRR